MKSTERTRICKAGLIKKFFVRHALKKRAKFLVRATERSEVAAKEVLYSLPGVFSMKLVAGGAEVRLIKEADQLRLMNSSEKSDVLLIIGFEDLAILGDLAAGDVTLQKAFAEGRATFSGKTKYFASVMRVNAEGDKALLGAGAYAELYGKDE